MKEPWEKRLAKLTWAKDHPDKVRESNRRWRAANLARVRRQAAARMRRLRARQKASKLL